MTPDEIGPGTRVTGELRDQAAAEVKHYYARGLAIRDIAKLMNRSYGWVHRTLSESGVELRNRGGTHRRGAPVSTRVDTGDYLQRLREKPARRAR